MSVEVRLFAALRHGAGADRVTVDAATVADLVAELRERYGEPFASRLAVSRIIVNTHQVAHDSDLGLAPDDEVVLLPPFSGG